MKHLALLRLHSKHGQKADNGGEHGCDNGPRDLVDGFQYDVFEQLSTHVHALAEVFFKVSNHVFHQHHAHIYHHTDGNSDARKRHNVGFDVGELHHNKGGEHRQRQHSGDNNRCPQVENEYQNNDDTDEHFVRKRTFECADGFFYQLRSVVKRYHSDLRHATVFQPFFGHSCLHLLYFRLYIVDNVHRIATVTRHNNSANSLLTLFIKPSATVAGPEIDLRHIFYAHRNTVARCNGSILQVGQTFDITQSANKIFGAVYLHRTRPHIDIGVLHCFHYLDKVHPIRAHGIRVEVYLILLDVSADRRHLGNSIGSGERITHVVILNGAQFLRIPASTGLVCLGIAPLERVPENLSERRCVGA